MEFREAGIEGERLAKQFLAGLGFELIDSNFRTRHGEIDLIFKDGDVLVLVEVKTRIKKAKNDIELSIDKRKVNRILKSAEMYIINSGLEFKEVRIDALFVELKDGGPVFKHIRSFY